MKTDTFYGLDLHVLGDYSRKTLREAVLRAVRCREEEDPGGYKRGAAAEARAADQARARVRELEALLELERDTSAKALKKLSEVEVAYDRLARKYSDL